MEIVSHYSQLVATLNCRTNTPLKGYYYYIYFQNYLEFKAYNWQFFLLERKNHWRQELFALPQMLKKFS